MNTVAAINGVFFLGVIWFIYRILTDEKNDLQCYQLISAERDGKQYVDINKIGQCMGVVIAIWMPFIYVNTDKMDATGLALVMGVSLTYLGGVSAYSKAIKAKQGTK